MNIILSVSRVFIYLFNTILLNVQGYLIIFSKYYSSKLIDIYGVPYIHHLLYTGGDLFTRTSICRFSFYLPKVSIQIGFIFNVQKWRQTVTNLRRVGAMDELKLK